MESFAEGLEKRRECLFEKSKNDGLENDKAELVRWMKARRVVFVVVVVVVMEGKRLKLVLVVKRDWYWSMEVMEVMEYREYLSNEMK